MEATRRDHDEAIEAEQAAGKRTMDLRLELAALASLLAAREPSSDDLDGLLRDLEGLAAAHRAALDRAAADRSKITDELGAVQERRRALEESVGIDASIDEALGSARAALELHEAEIQQLQGRLGEVDELEREQARFVRERDTHARLATDLTDARFIRYLLDEERERLADLGSDHFQRLSDGRYRFTDDGTFAVVDLTTAESVRKADSLSGGETFLASLALALALAEMVARVGGRLEAFLLDEGFGSLDPEHLDLAMEGIESLAAEPGDRLVVTVSHVPEMRHRIEDLIALDRDPATGDTRIVRA